MNTYTFLSWIFVIVMISSCGHERKTEEIQKYQDTIVALRKELKDAKTKIDVLSYPADQRLQKAKSLFENGDLDKASVEIDQLKKIFPNSPEASFSSELISKINEKKQAERQEEERIKALGFKAVPEQTTIKVDYNTVTYSAIGIGNRFVFDAYDNSWFYNDADRGNKYITMQMSVKSTNHNPDLPQAALYVISGDKMILGGTFETKFARWKDYGTYLGNYHDSSNDFSKVSTVKFKLGLQVSERTLAKPYAIVLKKKNVLSYYYEELSNPPISYIGSANYPSYLSLDDFKKDYVIIKRYNI